MFWPGSEILAGDDLSVKRPYVWKVGLLIIIPAKCMICYDWFPLYNWAEATSQIFLCSLLTFLGLLAREVEPKRKISLSGTTT